VVIVGAGRMGGALALGLLAARWPVAVLPRSAEGQRRAKRLNLPFARPEDLADARVCLLAVPDAAVPEVARSLAGELGAETVLAHCAGALSIDALAVTAELRAHALASFHPLVAVPDARADLSGRWVAVASNRPEVMPLLVRVALALRLRPLKVPDSARALYHAGAVLSAGLVVTLVGCGAQALEAAGVDPKEALPALLALAQSALDGVGDRGLTAGLTGPVIRGDVTVVRSHLSHLPESLTPVYRSLSLRCLELAGERVSEAPRAELRSLLEPRSS
jgi:predicted short-subunit dehydrogenase-like oxidoreductase (DUF2520 family)